jgi:ankyrin repeat protein
MKRYEIFVKEAKKTVNQKDIGKEVIEKDIQNNDIESIKEYIDSINEELMYEVCKISINYANTDIFKLLYNNLVEKSKKYEKKEIVTNLFRYVASSPELAGGSKKDNVEPEERENFVTNMINLLIEDGADIESNNKFPLRLSVEKGHVGAVKILLEKGCKPKETMLVNGSRNYEIFKMLVEKGADPNKNLNNILVTLSRTPNCGPVMKYLVDDLKIELKNDNVPTLTDKTSANFLYYLIIGGINAQYILKHEPKLASTLKDFEFQKELIERYPHRIKEIESILHPDIRTDVKTKDIASMSDWG